MNIDQIKANAPEGSTHWNPNNTKAIYYKVKDGKIKFWVDKHQLWYGSCVKLNELKPL